ncbi:hypothetical protein EVAR_61740_1 [Eumeta japonica]|uniref:Nucleic-acid-binding protein from transposon X-element n=1 Tax=Eumeta variegata TaxID=151549 RepID=A0A4C1YHT5_EUMVA|nr:hypothetical protein EVAR_61740_1 [Eumeta japonica]
MAAEVSSTRHLRHFDVSEELEEIRKALKAKPASRTMTDAGAAAKPKPLLKVRGTDFKIAKLENNVPTVVFRDIVKVNLDEDTVRSLRTQNRHISEGLDWDKERAKVCYRRQAQNHLECYPMLKVSTELYNRLIKASYVYVGLQRCPVWDQFPLIQCSRCSRFGHSKRYCKKVFDKCGHSGRAQSATPGAQRTPKCINCIKAGWEDTVHGTFSSECGARHKWNELARSKV